MANSLLSPIAGSTGFGPTESRAFRSFVGDGIWSVDSVQLSRSIIYVVRVPTMADFRRQIILDYAKWTALSALRSGAPIKSRKDVYPLLDAVAFADLLDSSRSISTSDFADWHERETNALCSRNNRLRTGWAVKLINVYLKTAAYVGDLGSKSLREQLHPPIDAGLWDGLTRRFPGRTDILDDACCVRRIKHITDYPIYRRVISGCTAAAQALGCPLIEVEQLWLGAATPND